MALDDSHNNDSQMTVLSPRGGEGDFSEGMTEECYHFKVPFFEPFVCFRSLFKFFVRLQSHFKVSSNSRSQFVH